MPNSITHHASRFTFHGALLSAFLLLPSAFPISAQVWITNSLTISETNTNYDGRDLLISGSGVTVAMDGSHALNSLIITNGAVLSHSPCMATLTHKLDLAVTNAVVVSTNSRIDVSGLGYLVGYTRGNTTVGAAAGVSGGSYGGLGGSYNGSANVVYGDYRDAAEWGSGGAVNNSYGGSSGGGRVRLVAGSLQMDGKLWANGADASGGAGSGGGVYVAVGTLVGSGSIQAKGGNAGNGLGSGGGGRIAVYAGDYSAFNLANITAPGGSSGTQGGAGSAYVKRNADPFGTLVIDTGSNGNGWAVLGLPGTNYYAVPDALVVRGSRTYVQTEHAGMTLDLQQSLTVQQNGYLVVNGVLSLQGSGALTVTGGGGWTSMGRWCWGCRWR